MSRAENAWLYHLCQTPISLVDTEPDTANEHPAPSSAKRQRTALPGVRKEVEPRTHEDPALLDEMSEKERKRLAGKAWTIVIADANGMRVTETWSGDPKDYIPAAGSKRRVILSLQEQT